MDDSLEALLRSHERQFLFLVDAMSSATTSRTGHWHLVALPHLREVDTDNISYFIYSNMNDWDAEAADPRITLQIIQARG